jgi:hypothetical protein
MNMVGLNTGGIRTRACPTTHMTASRTTLWKSAFADSRSDSSPEEQAFFRSHLEDMQERVRPLVARIATDIPEFTVHDETHLDALWEIASLIGSPNVTLNPPEAFVFGAAVLLHDAGMTLAAFPGGLAELKGTTAWADALALQVAQEQHSPSPPSPELEKELIATVLRRMHAEKAEELATQGWQTSPKSSDCAYLIEDTELRRFYGPKIGTLAHSHWWSISRVERELDYILGPMVPKTHSQVDLLKLACLLRTTDALHLDRRRAPYFGRILANPRENSALHWTAQQKLAFPRVDDDSIVFTAGDPFGREDADAWWVAYDALVAADRELKDADLLLRDRRDLKLVARRVRGAGDPVEMARHVSIQGWRPIDTRLKISDISKIAETFGGDQLYGNHPAVALRELLQNAMDAIDARRRLQGRPSGWGRIVVQIREDADGVWLSVEDTGIGMSEFVLTNVLLDFGASLWRSELLTEEFPGLLSKGMNAIGRFGIGFFSVFMLSDRLNVITRRYDRAETDSLLLEFHNGLASRPTLSSAPSKSAPIDGGTRIDIRLSRDPRVKQRFELHSKLGRPDSGSDLFSNRTPTSFSSLAQLVTYLAPTAEVNIEIIQFGKGETVVSPSDWLSISSARLAKRASTHELSKDEQRRVQARIREVKDSAGSIFGRAAIWPTTLYSYGALVTKGLRIDSMAHIVGFMAGETTVVSRSEGALVVPKDALAAWATEQAKLIAKQPIDDSVKAKCSELVLQCGGTIGNLPVAFWGRTWLNTDQLCAELAANGRIYCYADDLSYEDYDPVSKMEFDHDLKRSENVIFLPTTQYWRRNYLPKISSSSAYFLRLLNEVWGEYEQEDSEFTVALVNGQEIMRFGDEYTKP